MGQTLTHGIYLPDEGERNCYNGLAANWQLLDGAVGTIAEHTTQISGKAPLVHTHGKADITDLFNSANTWTSLNTYNGMVLLKSSSDVAEQFKQKLPKDVSVSTDALVRFNTLTDSEDHNVIVEALGHWANYVSKSTSLKYKNDSTKQGTIAFRLESSGSGLFYPQSPFECYLGNPSNQWKSVYAQSYYYNGVAWGLDKANEWTGENTFQAQSIYQVNSDPRYVYKSSSLEIGVQSTGSHTATSYWLDKNGNELGFTRFVEYDNSTQTYEIRLSNKAVNGTLNPTGNNIATNIQLALTPDGVSKLNLNVNALRPVSNGLSDLGDSTHRWKTLNGINPGALSLPDINDADPISTNNWVGDNSSSNQYTPTENGWIYFRIEGPNKNITIRYGGAGGDAPSITSESTISHLSVFFPVRSGVTMYIFFNGTMVKAFFYPCLGNV